MQISKRNFVMCTFLPIVVLTCFLLYLKKVDTDQIMALQNKVAFLDHTVEVQKGVFKKSTLELKDLERLLDLKSSELSLLNDELRKNRERLLSVTTASLKWKSDYEASVKGRQGEQPSEQLGGPPRARVDFERAFGRLSVDGYTLTNPPIAHLRLRELRPLKLTVAVAQSPDGSWKTYVTTDDDNVTADVKLSGVNSNVISSRWYERIGMQTSIGLSSELLVGVGLSVDLRRFSFGPNIWYLSGMTGPFYGGSFTWRPFVSRR